MPDRISNETASVILADLDRTIESAARRPHILGLAGAQGSGKSTIARLLAARLEAKGVRSAVLSLDDFYFGRAMRRRIAARVNPLFITRGPPGTHDVALALSVLSAIRRGEETSAPVFEKGADDTRPRAEWRTIPAMLDVLVFEGWCIGARPEEGEALSRPINMLERSFDRDGGWRRAVNDALGYTYQSLFAEIDRLVFLRAPSFDIVQRWRTEQEHARAASPHAKALPGLMTAEEISFFIQHFERLTRRMMEDLPSRADLVLQLDERRRVLGVEMRRDHR
ncbi:MAG: kinase [Pseudomonadota bacterium]